MKNKVPFFKYCAFLTQIRKKCARNEISSKNRIICDTDSINMWILIDEACSFTIFQILRHDDVITILY